MLLMKTDINLTLTIAINNRVKFQINIQKRSGVYKFWKIKNYIPKSLVLLITQARNDLYRKEQLSLPYYFLVSLLQIYPPVQKTNSLFK